MVEKLVGSENCYVFRLSPDNFKSDFGIKGGFVANIISRCRVLFNIFVFVTLDFLQVSVMRRDAVRTQVVDEVFEHVHHVGGDVVKGNRVVATAIRTSLRRIEDVTPIPHALRNVTRNEMMLGTGRIN